MLWFLSPWYRHLKLIYLLTCIKCYQIQVSEESRAPATASNTVSPSMRPTETCSFILLTSLSKFTAGKVPATLTERGSSWKLSLPPTYYIRPRLHPGHGGLCEQWLFIILSQQNKMKTALSETTLWICNSQFSLVSSNTHRSHRALLTIDLKNLSTSVSFWPVRSQVLLLLMSFSSSKVPKCWHFLQEHLKVKKLQLRWLCFLKYKEIDTTTGKKKNNN